MALITITGPAAEPIDGGQVKASARVDGDEFDGQIALIIPALRRHVEGRLGRRLIQQTVEIVLDGFPAAAIDLHLPDVTSIISVKYIDPNGVEQTLAASAYSLTGSGFSAWLFPAYSTRWPTARDTAASVRIRYVVGYGATASDVPEDIKLWMIARAVHLLNNPDGLTDGSVQPSPFLDGLLDAYKVWRTG